ncbi:nuclear transport factor 2 family protein [Neoroseomonas terrae]|nr:nuclear transport factor 2 family protein [Neoroseomonas terrae]
MLASDVARLEALIADDLVFVDQVGAVHGKAADLALHAAGGLVLERIDLSEQRILPLADGGACVSVRADIAGRYAGEPFAGAYRYMRVWVRQGAAWRVQAAQCTAIAG